MKKIFIWFILFYRKFLSPLKSTKCPYFPSCSQYGLEAVQRYGAFKGGLLSVWRILRCNPFSKGGYDPVPSSLNLKMLPITKTAFVNKKTKTKDQFQI